jgi:hypothetical protein
MSTLQAGPGERVATQAVSGGWGHDEVHATAVATAAALQICRRLIPVETWDPYYSQYAVVVEGCPAILGLTVGVDDSVTVGIRTPVAAESAAKDLLGRIVEQVRKISPPSPSCLDDDDELPF